MLAHVFVFTIVGLMALGVISTVSKVGQKRDPLTGAEAAGAVVLVGLEIAALIYVVNQLS